jgi:hypothetical protein
MKETPANEANPANPGSSKSPGVSDEQLMLAFSKGSPEAFTELFSRYKQPIYGFFRRRVSEAHHAEELTQETFLVLLRAAAIGGRSRCLASELEILYISLPKTVPISAGNET